MNRSHESMTRIQLGEWTVRVWRTEEKMQLGPKMEIVEALQVVDWWRFAHIAAVLNALPGISAYEILDEHGNGTVVYLDWPN